MNDYDDDGVKRRDKLTKLGAGIGATALLFAEVRLLNST